MPKNTVLNQLEKSNCTGCGACTAVCPRECLQLEPDAFGFPFPQLNEAACADCGRCVRTCPVLNPTDPAGQHTEAYAALSKDRNLRMESSSGGIFSELARLILSDHGAVYGAAWGDGFRVEHICTESEAGLAALRGAKYAQSALPAGMFAEIRERLNRGQPVLFSGTPCQAAGLKAFLGREYENLLTVDFVCHGIPSPGAWERYVHFRAESDNGGNLPECINLRSKSTGWSRYRYSNVYQYPDGRAYTSGGGSDLFMRLFVGDYINRESCAHCAFKGSDRVSDITIADFWGIWDIAPEMDDDRGTSLVLLHSERGRACFAKLSDRIRSRAATLEEAARQNPSLLRASPAKPERMDVLTAAAQGNFAAAEALLPIKKEQKPGILQRVKGKVRRVVKL